MNIAFQNENVTLWHGDCREWSGKADAVVSDPPYGMAWPCNMTSMAKRGPKYGGRDWGTEIKGDQEPFDPARWLEQIRNCFSWRPPFGLENSVELHEIPLIMEKSYARDAGRVKNGVQ